MGIDIRIPMGLMFSVFGAILTVYGCFSNKAIYAHSLGINVNLIWGLVLLLFGATMLTLGVRGNARARSKQDGCEKDAQIAATAQHGK